MAGRGCASQPRKREKQKHRKCARLRRTGVPTLSMLKER